MVSRAWSGATGSVFERWTFAVLAAGYHSVLLTFQTVEKLAVIDAN
jgi:hypothetical protein